MIEHYPVEMKLDIKVPMRDGVELSADIYLPRSDGTDSGRLWQLFDSTQVYPNPHLIFTDWDDWDGDTISRMEIASGTSVF